MRLTDGDSDAILDFFNSAQTCGELINGIRDDPDYGSTKGYGIRMKLAQMILLVRNSVYGGRFTSLDQIDGIWGVGPDTCHDIAYSFPRGAAGTWREAGLYWADLNARMIRWARPDGQAIETIVSTGPSSRPISLAVGGGYVFWADDNNHTISRADLDGSDILTLISGIEGVFAIEIDMAARHLYWTDRSTDSIRRSDCDGTGQTTVLTGAGVAGGTSCLVLDSAGSRLYWSDWSNEVIRRCNLDGGGFETLSIPDLRSPRRVAVDSGRGKIYWHEAALGLGQEKIRRCDLNGSNAENLYDCPAWQFLDALALDVEHGYLYYSHLYFTSNPTTEHRLIQRMNLDGSGIHTIIQDTGSIWQIVVSDRQFIRSEPAPPPAVRKGLLWTDNRSDRVLWVDPADASLKEVVATGPGTSGPEAVAATGEMVFWGDYLNDTISRVRWDGSDRETIVQGVSTPSGICIDVSAGRLYWLDQGQQKLQGSNLDGTDRTDVLTGLGDGLGRGVCDLAFDPVGRKFYWTDIGNDCLQRANIDGSGLEMIVTAAADSQPYCIAFDPINRKVYWSEFTTHRLYRSEPDGSNIELLITLAANQWPGPVAVDPEDGALYFSFTHSELNPYRQICHIWQAALNGTSAREILQVPGEIHRMVFVRV